MYSKHSETRHVCISLNVVAKEKSRLEFGHFKNPYFKWIRRRIFDWCDSSSRYLFDGTVHIKRIVLAYSSCKLLDTIQCCLVLLARLHRQGITCFSISLDEWMSFLLIRWRLLGQRAPEQGLELWWRRDFRTISVFDKYLRNSPSEMKDTVWEGDVFETQRDSTCMYLTERGSKGEIRMRKRTCWLLTCHISTCERELWKCRIFSCQTLWDGSWCSVCFLSIFQGYRSFQDVFSEEVRIRHANLHKAEG